MTALCVGSTEVSASAPASITSGPGSFVGSPTCSYTGGGATASCTVVITSATTGTTLVRSEERRVGKECRSQWSTKDSKDNNAPASKTWADATIAITPATATNAVGTNHTLTITVTEVATYVGTVWLDFSIAICRASFVGSPTCSYTGPGATASCTVVITSATTGTTLVSATSSIPLTGDGSVTRTTDGTAGNSAPASKTWADATIAITPATATNAVGTNHTLTITVTAVGTTFVDGTATASITSVFASSARFPSCSYTGAGATASCTVVITSGTTGTTLVSATSSIPLTGGGAVNRTTDGTAGTSGPATKL